MRRKGWESKNKREGRVGKVKTREEEEREKQKRVRKSEEEERKERERNRVGGIERKKQGGKR